MNTSLGWFAFVRARDHPLSSKSIGHRIKPCRNPIFDLSSEDVIARRREAERIAASGTPLSVRGRAAHICLINGCRSVLVAITARLKSNVYRPVAVGVARMPR